MKLLKGLALGLRFLLELEALLALGAAGFRAPLAPPWPWLPGLGLPLLFAAAWGRWAAPRSPRRLQGARRLGFELAAFGVAGLALAAAGRPRGAVLYAGLVLLDLALLRHWEIW